MQTSAIPHEDQRSLCGPVGLRSKKCPPGPSSETGENVGEPWVLKEIWLGFGTRPAGLTATGGRQKRGPGREATQPSGSRHRSRLGHCSGVGVVFVPTSPVRRHVGTQFVSNVGSWMQTVAAQWLMLSLTTSATYVALVQTAAGLPVVLFAILAGT